VLNADRKYPATCPACAAVEGRPASVSTLQGDARLEIRMRCHSCEHAWRDVVEMSEVHRAGKPGVCYCCQKPLTLTRKIDHDRHVIVETWDCTDLSCITYRQQRPGIPDPPKSK
jgi:hypothetical protein